MPPALYETLLLSTVAVESKIGDPPVKVATLGGLVAALLVVPILTGTAS